MPISSEELYEYLVQEGYKKADGGVLAEHMREFVRQYYHETRTTPGMVYALWGCFKQSRDHEENKKSLETCSKVPPFRYTKEEDKLWRYNNKKEMWTEVKDSYFINVLRKAYPLFIDKEGIQWAHLNQQKKLRLRKKKA